MLTTAANKGNGLLTTSIYYSNVSFISGMYDANKLTIWNAVVANRQ